MKLFVPIIFLVFSCSSHPEPQWITSQPNTENYWLGIGSVEKPRTPHPWITKYIFPGGYTPSLSELTVPIEKSGLVISDIEVLRMHYAYTLKNWKDRFTKNKDKVLKMFDEKFFRMWEFYLVSCEKTFEWGDQVVYQLQLTKSMHIAPNTRDYIYK